MNVDKLRVIKSRCLASHLDYTRYFFIKRYGYKFIVRPHHTLICDTLDKVISGDITRLIINIAPRYSKTELSVISFVSRGLAINPFSRFIHVSYSSDLAWDNSRQAREIIESDEYQELWPIKVSQSDHGKKKWEIDNGGGMLAAPSGGAITGFGAGVTGYEGFSGAIIVDDPLKPMDAHSEPLRRKTNDQFAETLFSRLAHSEVPIIVIMQRLHEDDATAHLLKGGMNGEKWYHLNLPNPIPEKPQSYPTEFTHGIPIEHNLEPGALWPYKHTEEQLKLMEASNPYVYYSQYAQEPTPPGGSIFKDGCFHYYTELPKLKYRFVTADTAMKVKEHNDFSVFQCWGLGEDNKLYLTDQIRGKWEAPDLELRAVAFWNKHSTSNGNGKLRYMGIEDKASGTGLIQKIRYDNQIYVKAIQRDRDKVSRAHDGVPYMFMGKVLLPKNAPWINEYITEFRKFNPEMTHAHDDQIDPTLDAIEQALDPRLLTSLGFAL